MELLLSYEGHLTAPLSVKWGEPEERYLITNLKHGGRAKQLGIPVGPQPLPNPRPTLGTSPSVKPLLGGVQGSTPEVLQGRRWFHLKSTIRPSFHTKENVCSCVTAGGERLHLRHRLLSSAHGALLPLRKRHRGSPWVGHARQTGGLVVWDSATSFYFIGFILTSSSGPVILLFQFSLMPI